MRLTRHPFAAARSQNAQPLGVYFALLFVLAVLGAIAGALYVDRAAERDARNDATGDARHSATIAAKQLDNFARLLQATPASLAANPALAGVLAKPAGCTLNFQGLSGPDGSHLDIVAADGTVACSSRKIQAGDTYAGSAWLKQALAKPSLFAPRKDAVTGVQVAIATAPLAGGKGFVAAFADLTTMGKSLAELYGGGRPSVFAITSADGSVISRSEHPERWIGTPYDNDRLELADGAERDDLEGVTRLWADAPVPSVDWKVHVGEEKATALAAVARLRTRQLVVIGASLALLLLIGAFVYRKVAVPIRRLSTAVRATRDPEHAAPLPVSGPVEMQTLAEDVNALTASVRDQLRRRREAEESYRRLFERNPSPMWVYDAETLRFLAVNDAAVATYGWSREEFLAMSIEDIRPAEQVERLHSELAATSGGLNQAGTWRHRRKDGSELDVEITSHDHRFESRPARVVLAIDVTERIASERALRRSEARYRELFENASDLITTVDLDGRITAVNEAFVNATGYGREELIGRRLEELVPADARPVLAAAHERKLAGADKTIYEHELLARDGRRLRVEVSSRFIEEDGEAVGTEAICRDITERRQLEEQLRQAQRLEAIGRLAGGISHDFNNLLTVIGGYTETLLIGREPGTEPELEQIAAAAERAAVLTRQLLAFSRRQVLQPRTVLVNDVVEGLAPMLTRLIGEDVQLVSALAPTTDPVLADPSQLEQILVNLAVNARDAMPSGGRLTIQTGNVELDEHYVAKNSEATVGPHVMLSVTDNGTGMDAETLSHVFEPFFTTKPAGTGTGLGLATVYGIVKQSGGSIWAYSELGEGTTFKVLLPRTESNVVEETLRPPRPVAANGSETILLAEDEASLRRLTVRILERHGYKVIAAKTPVEALEIAEQQSETIDLLLTDLIMPELSGGDLAKQVSEIVPGVRVLFMSGYADDVVARSGSLEPNAPFLEKPFSANDLATKIRETLDAAA